VNASLRADFPPGRFVTLIYAVLDAARHTLTFANAGHLPPVLCRGADCSSVPTDFGLPLGIFDSDFSESQIDMDRRSSVVLYTDGIIETTDAAGNEYGIDRLSHALAADSPSAQSLTNDVIRYSGSQSLADDATVVLVRRAAE
jgi:sigma-B regulation protein RsbU (phosphoserine phosphatase)